MRIHKMIFAALLVNLFTVSQATYAGSDIGVESANNKINFWFGNLKQDYREFNDGLWPGGPNILDSETGTIRGYEIDGGAFTHGIYVFAHLGFYRGDTDYTGFDNTLNPVTTTTENRIADQYVKAGYLWKVDKGTYFGPTGEFGLLGWRRQIGRGTSLAVDEEYRHMYAGLGLVFLYGFTDNLSMKLETSYGKTFGATVSSQQFDFSNQKLGSENTSRGGITLDYRLTGGLYLMAGADFLKFGYGASETNSSGFTEPRSETERTMYKVGLGYSFK